MKLEVRRMKDSLDNKCELPNRSIFLGQMFEQTEKHLGDFLKVCDNFLARVNLPQPFTKDQQTLSLSARPESNSYEASEVGFRPSTMALSNVGRNRHDGSSNLALDSKSFFFWQFLGQVVNHFGIKNCSLPNLKVLKRLAGHSVDSTNRISVTSDFQLLTSN